MNKVLVIGETVVISALCKVMDLFNQFEYVAIEVNSSGPEDCLNSLARYKDNDGVMGIVLAFPHGDDIAKHIRLTEALGRLCLLPLLVLTHKPVLNTLKSKTDNVFLLSPQCYPIPVSSCIGDILVVLGKGNGFASEEEKTSAVRPFVVWSEEDNVTSRHDNFNRYGPFKLLIEQFGTLPEPLSSHYENMTRRLWFKKFVFLETSDSGIKTHQEFDDEPFRKAARNKKVLYIDDEHRLGWSFALYSILNGNCDGDKLSAFEGTEHLVLSPCGRLACVDSYPYAASLIAEYKRNLSSSLSTFSDMEAMKNNLEERYSILAQEIKTAEGVYKRAKETVEGLEAELQKTNDEINCISNKLKKSVHGLADTYTGCIGEPAVDAMSVNLDELNRLYRQWREKKELNTKIYGNLDAHRKKLEECRDNYEQNNKQFEKIRAEKDVIRKKYDNVVRDLDPRGLFPYDLIILDLRLEKEDRDASAREISGIKLLRDIKEVDPGIPVIVFTASEKALNYKTAKELGASDYWIKAVNTAADLKSAIIGSIEKNEKARLIWHDIKKVEAKKQLRCVSESQDGRQLEEGNMDDATKNTIVSLLKESFLLYLRESYPYEQYVCNYDNYAKIALNVGLIQELRIKAKEGRWDFWTRQRKINSEETKVRRIRNLIAHQAGATLSPDDALEVQKITINKCLASRLL